MGNNHRISVGFDDTQYDYLKEKADALEVSVAEVVRNEIFGGSANIPSVLKKEERELISSLADVNNNVSQLLIKVDSINYPDIKLYVSAIAHSIEDIARKVTG